MKIGELAKATGTRAETIRFYEAQGLLPKAVRTDANYRVYGEAHKGRLAFIRHCRSLDMTLDEIVTLLRFRDAPDQDCEAVNDLLDQHIAHVTVRIKELKHLHAELKVLRDQCGAAREASACGILNGLDSAARRKPKPRSGHIRGSHRGLGA